MSCKQHISLKFAVTIPFLIIFITIISVVLSEQANIYNQMITHVSEKLLDSSSRSINIALHNLLEAPQNANLSMRHTIERDQLYLPEKHEKLLSYLNNYFDTELNTHPQIDIIGFGSKNGNYYGFKKNKNHNTFSLLLKNESTENHLNIYQSNNTEQAIIQSIPNYDPRLRPWYTKSVENDLTLWSNIYASIEEKKSQTLSAIAPIYNKEKQLQGVITTDVMLSSFNAFLDKEAQAISGDIAILDKSGQVWLHSGHSPDAPFNHSIARLETIKNPITKEIVRYIDKVGFNNVIKQNIISLNINENKHFLTIKPFTSALSIQVYIIASLPESVLLGRLPEQRNHSILLMVLISLFSFMLAAYVIRRLIQPIIDTAASARALSEGNWDTHLPVHCGTEEVATLTHSFKVMATNLRRSFQELQDKVTYDSLTLLYSRTGLADVIAPHIHSKSALISFSVNGFRDINDAVGHLSGDHLLTDIAQRLKTHYQIDNIKIARIGGAEFALFFYSMSNQEELIKYAKQLHSIFNTPIQSNSGEIVIQLSTGLVYQLDHNNVMEWLRNASLALAYAQSAPDNIAVFEPYMAKVSSQKTQLAAELSHAIKNKELIPFYQPLVDFNTGEVHGAEALIRWESPTKGLISPSQFIPLAEDNGMIIQIGHEILLQACIDTAEKISSGEWPKNFIIHVNVSTEQLHYVNCFEKLMNVLKVSGLAPHNLSLELIESRLLNDNAFIIELLQKVRAFGIHLAIDDFGTGYSSLSYLHTLPFDCLKIDRSFVEGLTYNNANSSIAKAIVNIAKGFNVSIVAEGIETTEQARILKEMGCNVAQGYLYSKPLPLESWPSDLSVFKRI